MNLPYAVPQASLRWPAASLLVLLVLASVGAAWAQPTTPMGPATPAAEEPQRHLQFVEEFAATCVARQGVQILMKNTHPTRTLRVWMERYHMGVGTGDRSRTDLKPGAEPDALGCSRTLTGAQEWKLVRAVFVD